MKSLVHRNVDLMFVGVFLALGLLLLWVPFRWDEDIFVGLANNLLLHPLNPLDAPLPPMLWEKDYPRGNMLLWVPHPPLLSYAVALFYPLPRLAPLLISTIAVLYVFYVTKRLYGREVAGLAVAALVTNWLFMVLSYVIFIDGVVSAFMGIAVFSFLGWANLKEKKFLMFCGLGLALAALTKYTAVPILLATFLVWLILLRKRFSWADVVQLFLVMAVSLIPVAYWIYLFSQVFGNPLSHYGGLYGLFPSGNILFPLINVVYYLPWVLAMVEFPLISWFRQRQLDSNSKLILIYAAIVIGFFLLLYAQQFRYLLPIVPPLSIVTAINLVKEKPSARFSMLLAHLVLAVGITIIALVLYVFQFYPYRSF